MTGRRLAGKAVLVTAAAQGIGRATAIACAAEGARVWAADINGERLAELEGVAGIERRVLDATDGTAIAAALPVIGALDGLVNAVGWVHHGTILDCGEAEWDRSFAVNVRGMYLLTRAALPGMIAKGGGSIVNISSVVSSVRAAPNRFAYAATKAAIVGFTKSIAVDFVKQGIRCNAVCPGTVASPSLEERIAAFPDPAAARAQFIARHPMGRVGRPEEIAEACVYLLSDAAAFTTGAVLVIDGGMSL
jgi:2-keto-3-deoxy-L-fuconate dehydrogenase